ncbi:MAG: AcrR family transcriptional regulator [Myxococcota bacterium]|jgi:AcrR family transcriptional regulator
MPRATFDNLPADKRSRFVEAALDEFSAHPYDQASISRIVARLGIAKGSVYQYFDGKAALFAWLVEEAGRQKFAIIRPEEAPSDVDMFGRLRWMYVQGLRFQASRPRWARIGLRVMEPSRDPAVGALRQKHNVAARAFLRDQLSAGQAEGSVRAGLDLDMMVPLIQSLLTEGLLRAFLSRAGVDDPLDPAVRELSEADAMAVVDAALDLLRQGLLST